MSERKDIKTIIESKADALGDALPDGMKISRFVKLGLSAVRNNPKLAQCSVASLLGSLMTCAQLGLEPNSPLGLAYIIPYWNSKTKQNEAQFQIGYKGAVNLAYRHGRIDKISAKVVYEKDEFDYQQGTEDYIKHKVAKGDRGEPVYYYAIYTTVNGNKEFSVWSYQEVFDHATQYSGSWDKNKNEFRYGSAWLTAFDAMALKTVVIDLMRFAPQAVEFDLIQQAVGSDNKVVNFNEYSDGSGEVVVGEMDFESNMTGFEE